LISESFYWLYIFHGDHSFYYSQRITVTADKLIGPVSD
jgi:hypothetical protein